MGSSRTDVLKNMLEQDGNNIFARYGLAMEYVNAGDLETAVGEFEKLLSVDPNYVAGYYHGGQTLERLGRIEDARAVYEKGLVACSRIGDVHTQSEIRVALDLLG